MMSLWKAVVIAVCAVVASFSINAWIVGDYVKLRRRVASLEADAKTFAENDRIAKSLINMCLDSINELANTGGSITEEHTVPEVRQ